MMDRILRICTLVNPEYSQDQVVCIDGSMSAWSVIGRKLWTRLLDEIRIGPFLRS